MGEDGVIEAWPGEHLPLGATWDGEGTNFALFSEHAEAVDLVLFNPQGGETARYALSERTDLNWHGYVYGVGPGQLYGFRVRGAFQPSAGQRFNHHKLLLDPYTRAVHGSVHWGPELFGYDWQAGDDVASTLDSSPCTLKSVVIDPYFPWGDDRQPKIHWSDTVIYETHVRGFTMRHPQIPPALRGTYAGLAHPAAVRHLLDLGVTTVELMPVHQFIDQMYLVERGLRNYWGYDSIAYFAPEDRYSADSDSGGQVREFKAMVRALHQAGLEVILDVVYNHSAEGNHKGPMLAFRGIDNQAYYRLVEHDPRYYMDFTGCGNTLNVRQAQALQLIMDSLRYWVTEMHVDGFRFDIAAALARQFYEVDRLSAFFDLVHQDPVLSRVKLIAEPWDVGPGGYQVGNFPVRWAEWNGRYRDTVRDFWRAWTPGVGDLAYRLSGSSDLYGDDGRRPWDSINFVTCHDGFTLRDLVGYNGKHNEANGEDNRDGSDDNRSWNCGAEGDTDDPHVNALRRRQQRNFLATLLVSQGCPMLLHGDEIGRSQRGNNNAFCQDNETSWVDWQHADDSLLAFARRAIALRRAEPVLRRRRFFQGPVGSGHRRKDVVWFRPDGEEMTDGDWQDTGRHALGMLLDGQLIPDRLARGERVVGNTLLVLMNSHYLDLSWRLPGDWADAWEVVLDTAQEGDEQPDGRRHRSGQVLSLQSRSLIVLRALQAQPLSS